METNQACWLSDTRCTSCNAGFHLEYQEIYVCGGYIAIVSYGCGSC